jgi:arsenate reductase
MFKSLTLIFIMSVFVGSSPLLPKLERYCAELPKANLSKERKKSLEELGDFVAAKLKAGQVAHLNFICTHNSRRSQLSQAWAMAAAHYKGLDISLIQTYSGGTEATAFNSRAVAALQRAGFEIESDNAEQNPRYTLSFAPNAKKLTMFSKKYSEEPNPKQGFCAIMVCSQADESCPIVLGAEKRISHSYVDPKRDDGKPNEAQTYDETTRLIAQEMMYAFEYAAKKLKK